VNGAFFGTLLVSENAYYARFLDLADEWRWEWGYAVGHRPEGIDTLGRAAVSLRSTMY
jgi:hypothetical protein